MYSHNLRTTTRADSKESVLSLHDDNGADETNATYPSELIRIASAIPIQPTAVSTDHVVPRTISGPSREPSGGFTDKFFAGNAEQIHNNMSGTWIQSRNKLATPDRYPPHCK
jgi:hypothetical protein